nr:uncharacterized protein LOC112279059 [Physcomitrium patens]|eukprot:XP_024368898.1 uncharacterized protein LOC112279059 [Physcomitrella patens]
MFGNEIRSINRVQLRCPVEWHETWTSPNGYHRLHHSKAAGDEGFYLCASSSYNSINSRRGIPASHNPMTDLMGAYTTSEIFGAVQDVLFLHTAMPQFTARSSGKEAQQAMAFHGNHRHPNRSTTRTSDTHYHRTVLEMKPRFSAENGQWLLSNGVGRLCSPRHLC